MPPNPRRLGPGPCTGADQWALSGDLSGPGRRRRGVHRLPGPGDADLAAGTAVALHPCRRRGLGDPAGTGRARRRAGSAGRDRGCRQLVGSAGVHLRPGRLGPERSGGGRRTPAPPSPRTLGPGPCTGARRWDWAPSGCTPSSTCRTPPPRRWRGGRGSARRDGCGPPSSAGTAAGRTPCCSPGCPATDPRTTTGRLPVGEAARRYWPLCRAPARAREGWGAQESFLRRSPPGARHSRQPRRWRWWPGHPA